MNIFTIISKYKYLALTLAILSLLIVFIGRDFQTDDKNFELAETIEKIDQLWSNGGDGCSDIPASVDFKACHQQHLFCDLQKLTDLSILGYQENLAGDLTLQLAWERQKFSLKLLNRCHRALLPSGVYSSGPRGYAEEIWSNENQEIWIDRFYVSQYKIKKWFQAKNIPHGKLAFSPRPALHLSLQKMQEFCRDQKGQLLQSQILDAASFYPAEGENSLQLKSFYPWSKARELKKDCEHFIYQGCDPVADLNRSGVSWMGIFHTLGGEIEVVDNPFQPRANLKLSSIFLPVDSPWHQLGLRAHWSGRGLGANEFDLREQYLGRWRADIKISGVAFRCMYYY